MKRIRRHIRLALSFALAIAISVSLAMGKCACKTKNHAACKCSTSGGSCCAIPTDDACCTKDANACCVSAKQASGESADGCFASEKGAPRVCGCLHVVNAPQSIPSGSKTVLHSQPQTISWPDLAADDSRISVFATDVNQTVASHNTRLALLSLWRK